MTFPAANLRFSHAALRFFTKRLYLHAALKNRRKWARYYRGQLHVLTGVRARDFRHGAGFTKVGSPLVLRFQQAALFHIATTEVIAVEIFTFTSSRCFHLDKERAGLSARLLITRASHIRPCEYPHGWCRQH